MLCEDPAEPANVSPPDGTAQAEAPSLPAPSTWTFRHISVDEAARKKGALTARRKASRVYPDKLWTSPEQKVALKNLYARDEISCWDYLPEDEEDQLNAAAQLAGEGLDLSGTKALGNRWSVRWNRDSGAQKGYQETRRQLYQCDCGYYNKSRKTAVRRSPVDFTGCLGHAEVLFEVKTGRILWLRGHFAHNQGCKDAFLTRIPPMPLHPSVFALALKQLQSGAHLTDIQATNRATFRAGGYTGQPKDLRSSPNRWLLQRSDTRSLYRQFNRLRGVNTTVQPHINVHEWLDPKSPAYNKTFAKAIFHYSARAAEDERFEVCLATKEMKAAAWKYSHDSQIILDGTFGLCDRKLLVFIVMGIDEKRRGVPLAFLMFSAPSGNRHTAAGYDTDILEKLLSHWRASLGTRNGCTFTPLVAITDTDLKERGALLRVFPVLWLLLCKFHLRQSWRNHRARVLKGPATSCTLKDLRGRLRTLELSLIAGTSHEVAMQLITAERTVLEAAGSATAPSEQALISGALEHLKYLETYWMSESLWQSWSEHGRQKAADLLGCSIEGVIPTTNHLESFNGVLKNKHLRRWQRGGRRVRIDVLLHLFVFSIIPAIFGGRALEDEEDQRREAQLKNLPGGENLVLQWQTRNQGGGTSITHLAGLSQSAQRSDGHAFLVPDAVRDQAAKQLVEDQQISVPTFQEHSRTFAFDCFSSSATVFDILPTSYVLFLGLDGSAACSCPDFEGRGGACKHIRAALLRLALLRNAGLQIPSINLPVSEEEACTRFENNVPFVSEARGHQGGPASIALSNTESSSEAAIITRHLSDSRGQNSAQFAEEVLRESGDMFVTSESAEVAFLPDEAGGMGNVTIPDVEDTDMESDGFTTAPASEASDTEEDTTAERPGTPAVEDIHVRNQDGQSCSPNTDLPMMDSPDGRVEARAYHQTRLIPPALSVPQSGLNRQIIERVFRDLEADGPRLRQLGDYLKDAQITEADVERTQAVKDDIDVLTMQLSRLLREVPPAAAALSSTSTPTAHTGARTPGSRLPSTCSSHVRLIIRSVGPVDPVALTRNVSPCSPYS